VAGNASASGFGAGAVASRIATFILACAQCMSKAERFKEEIGWLKALCALLTAGLTSLVVWVVQNYGRIDRVILLMALLGLLGLAASLAVIVARLYRCFRALEGL
jgi:hypothetical protein